MHFPGPGVNAYCLFEWSGSTRALSDDNNNNMEESNSMNMTILSGRAVDVATKREIMRNGKPNQVANFRIAVPRPYKVEGERPTDFYQVECWGTLADTAEKYITKGKFVIVVGTMDARPSKATVDGQEVIYKNMSLRCERLEFGPNSFETELERRNGIEAQPAPIAQQAPVAPAVQAPAAQAPVAPAAPATFPQIPADVDPRVFSAAFQQWLATQQAQQAKPAPEDIPFDM